MKPFFTTTLCLTFILLFSSCKTDEKKNSDANDTNTQISTGDTSQNSLDWAGTYQGELPCADCDGIKTIVTINNDNTYAIKEVYLGKDATIKTSNGTFKWDAKGQKIIPSDDTRHDYFVGENTLTLLDENGSKITGDLEALYILHKVNDVLTGKKWHLALYKGKEVVYKEAMSEHAYIEFNEDMTINGFTGCNNLHGGYTVSETHKIEFSNLLNTLKACPEMETESKFLEAINSADAYGFENHDLIVYDKDHNKLATFKIAN